LAANVTLNPCSATDGSRHAPLREAANDLEDDHPSSSASKTIERDRRRARDQRERIQVREAPGFRMRQHARNGCYHVLLAGELDSRTGRELVRAVRRICPDAHRITVDMRAVTFIDSAGLGRLMAVKAICAEHYVDVVLVTTDPGPGGEVAAPLGPLDRLRRRAPLACENE
jgi:anti-anti-sigma factor